MRRSEAALKLIKFMTAPEQAAEWSIATGYMGVSPAAYETEALKAYTAEFPPALVARDQLEHAVAEFSTFETARVREGLNNAIQAALTGTSRRKTRWPRRRPRPSVCCKPTSKPEIEGRRDIPGAPFRMIA
jgi:ABC-type glycerol-3-phosphate transport system substrate-binding protein